MNKKQESGGKNLVTAELMRDFAQGLRELAANCDEVVSKMQEKSITEFVSTNYTATQRGLVLVTRFVAGAAGLVATHKAADLLRVGAEDDSPDATEGKRIAAEAKDKYEAATKRKR